MFSLKYFRTSRKSIQLLLSVLLLDKLNPNFFFFPHNRHRWINIANIFVNQNCYSSWRPKLFSFLIYHSFFCFYYIDSFCLFFACKIFLWRPAVIVPCHSIHRIFSSVKVKMERNTSSEKKPRGTSKQSIYESQFTCFFALAFSLCVKSVRNLSNRFINIFAILQDFHVIFSKYPPILRCYVGSSMSNLKRRSDRIVKKNQYIRYQNKTYIYLLNQKRPQLAHPAPRYLWLGSLCPTVWFIAPHRWGTMSHSAIFTFLTFHICLKCFCNIYCKCIMCPKVYIKRSCMVFPITSSWKNYQSSRKRKSPLYPTFPYSL